MGKAKPGQGPSGAQRGRAATATRSSGGVEVGRGTELGRAQTLAELGSDESLGVTVVVAQR